MTQIATSLWFTNQAEEAARFYCATIPGATLGEIVGSWKRFTAREANKHLGRAGTFWQTEYWDRFIRNEVHFHAAEDYIDQNPVKAGLAIDARSWPYGSARLRA